MAVVPACAAILIPPLAIFFKFLSSIVQHAKETKCCHQILIIEDDTKTAG